ncbi:MAG: DUF4910 domain-containing protein [Planctomycetota bacterium]
MMKPEFDPDHPECADGLWRLLTRLFPLRRSLTGPGVRQTLDVLQEYLPNLQRHRVTSGTSAFDWQVPDEWTLDTAWLDGPGGERILDTDQHILHVLGYSEPVDRHLDLTELQAHLHSLPEQPEAIPYVTSYYHRRWGFCLSHAQRQQLPAGNYHAVIRSRLAPGHMDYGELYIPGASQQEILLSTYICHPGMANNEASGPSVATWLASWLQAQPQLRYSYRILFLPETIGAIVYISEHLQRLRERVIAGHMVTCVGDERCYSFLPSKRGDTLADRMARHMLDHLVGDYITYSFLQRGSDERQFCSVGVDLPVCSVMRSKYEAYPEYHTHLDDLSLVSPAGLAGSYRVLRACLEGYEHNRHHRMRQPCEPQLGRHGLYPTISHRGCDNQVSSMMDLIAYADGERDLLDLAETIGVPMPELYELTQKLCDAGLMETCEPGDPEAGT